jgi:hypothetical protein
MRWACRKWLHSATGPLPLRVPQTPVERVLVRQAVEPTPLVGVPPEQLAREPAQAALRVQIPPRNPVRLPISMVPIKPTTLLLSVLPAVGDVDGAK